MADAKDIRSIQLKVGTLIIYYGCGQVLPKTRYVAEYQLDYRLIELQSVSKVGMTPIFLSRDKPINIEIS